VRCDDDLRGSEEADLLDDTARTIVDDREAVGLRESDYLFFIDD
jgi:hypothetical protein